MTFPALKRACDQFVSQLVITPSDTKYFCDESILEGQQCQSVTTWSHNYTCLLPQFVFHDHCQRELPDSMLGFRFILRLDWTGGEKLSNHNPPDPWRQGQVPLHVSSAITLVSFPFSYVEYFHEWNPLRETVSGTVAKKKQRQLNTHTLGQWKCLLPKGFKSAGCGGIYANSSSEAEAGGLTWVLDKTGLHSR